MMVDVRHSSVFIYTSHNGFTVRVRAGINNTMPDHEVYTFESFKALQAWLKENLQGA
jgi:hypothetical protein